MDSFQNASDYAKDGSETKRMAIVNIGNLYQKKGKNADAATRYLEALEQSDWKNDPVTLCNLGLALSTTQYKDYAMMAFEEAVELSPGDSTIVQNFLICLLEWGHNDKFRQLWRHAS